MKFKHLFLGKVTLADPSLEQAVANKVGPETFVQVVDQYGEHTTARVRQLEPIEEVVIPETHRSLNTLADEILGINRSKGWTPSVGEETNLDRNLMLIVGELSEAQEELRAHHDVYEVYYRDDKPGPQGFGIEIADVIIRTLGLCAELDLDIDALVRDKIEFNKTRPFKHGGKKF